VKKTNLLTLILITVTILSFAQEESTLGSNFKVFVSETFNRNAKITIQLVDNDMAGGMSLLTNALASKGFKTVSSSSISNKTEREESNVHTDNSSNTKTTISNTSYVNSNYLFTFHYNWINGDFAGVPTGKIQCSNFSGQIVDLNNNSEIVATFSYMGKFKMDAIANAVAQKLNTISGNSTTKEKGTPSIDKINSPKTKEERLKELKQFYDKQLITKEEYQEQKKKVLEE